MYVSIVYKLPKRSGEALKDITSIFETDNGIAFVTPLKAMTVVAKSEIETITIFARQ